MAALSRAVMLALLAAVLSDAVPLPEGQSYDFHAESCPHLETMVHDAVQVAINKDVGVVAGLLKILFHDCFPQGCDASLLLTGPGSELEMAENYGLQQGALALIGTIHAAVQGACGPTVSCADITGLAIKHAVMQSGVPEYLVPLGRKDSLVPATHQQVKAMPDTDATANQLLESFASRGFDEADLVALSGAHTVGQASCPSFKNRTGENSEFVSNLRRNCSGFPSAPLQDLDVTTPTTFDNKYYINLKARKGVFNSDMALTHDTKTNKLVENFAGNQELFFAQFSASMSKLSHLQGEPGTVGEIRSNCFRVNRKKNETAAEGFAASA